MHGKEKNAFDELIHPDKLHEAIVRGLLPDLEDLILCQGIKNATQKNAEGFTPLAAAVMAGRADMVSALLNTNWDLAINEKCGPLERTALSLAICNKAYDIAILLLEKEDISSENEDIKIESALYHAFYHGYCFSHDIESDIKAKAHHELCIKLMHHPNIDFETFLHDQDADYGISGIFCFEFPLSLIKEYINHPDSNLVTYDDDEDEREIQFSFLSNSLMFSMGREDVVETLIRVTDQEIGINWCSRFDGTALSEAIIGAYLREDFFWGRYEASRLMSLVLDHPHLDVNIDHGEQPMVDALLKYAASWARIFDENEDTIFVRCNEDEYNSMFNIGFEIIKKFCSHPMLELEDSKAIKIFSYLIKSYEENYKANCSDSRNYLIKRYDINRETNCSDALENLINSKIERLLKIDEPAQEEVHSSDEDEDEAQIVTIEIPHEFSDFYAQAPWNPPTPENTLVQLSPLQPGFHPQEAFLAGETEDPISSYSFWLG